MGTVPSVKGMEFPYIFILDGGWEHNDMKEEGEDYSNLKVESWELPIIEILNKKLKMIV